MFLMTTMTIIRGSYNLFTTTMRRILLFYILLTAPLQSFAQRDGFVQINKDVFTGEKRCYAGEILPYKNSIKAAGKDARFVDICAGEHLFVTDVKINTGISTGLEKVTVLDDTTGLGIDLKIVKEAVRRSDGMIFVNRASLAGSQLAFLVTQRGERRDLRDQEERISQTEVGESFRISVSGRSSLLFQTDELEDGPFPTADSPNLSDKKTREDEPEAAAPKIESSSGAGAGYEVKDKVSTLTELAYVQLIVLIAGIGAVLYLLVSRHRGSSAEASPGGTYQAPVADRQSSSPYDIAGHLKSLERNLLEAIRGNKQGGSSNVSRDEIGSLRNQLDALKSEKQQQAQAFDSDKKRLEADIARLKSDLAGKDERIQQTDQKLNELDLTLLRVPELKETAQAGQEYLSFCRQVVQAAYAATARLDAEPGIDSTAAALLLQKYQMAANELPIGQWEQIMEDIVETGSTVTERLMRSLRQTGRPEEHRREFTRQLTADVLARLTSAVLALAEAFRNVQQFCGQSSLGSEIENQFSVLVRELLARSSARGLEMRYAPLFQRPDSYPVKDVNLDRSPAFKLLRGLPSGTVVEVVEYGYKSDFNETDTRIILSR